MVSLRVMTADDGRRVLAIYEEGIATGNATFADAPPTWEVFDKDHRADCRLVVELDGEIVGWAALSTVSSRCVYGGVAELSVYVSAAARGRKIGGALLDGLIDASERAGIWTLQAGVFPENAASLTLHTRAGFRMLGRRERIGRMTFGPWAGQWRDVTLLERRSAIVGADGQ